MSRKASGTDGKSKATDVINIGIWGPKGAGKTTYIAVLYHSRKDSGWTMKAADEESDRFRLEAYRLLFGQGNFPMPTNPSRISIYTYDFSCEGLFGKGQSFRLVFADASGEWFEKPYEMRSMFPDIVTPYDRLAKCQGLVLLLDPIQASQSQVDHYVTISRALGMLRRVASNSGANKPIRPYMAVCFTKMDHESHRKYIHWEGERMREYAQYILGNDTFNDIDEACDPARIEFFGCSSIGWLHDKKTNQDVPNVFRDEHDEMHIKYPDKIKPVNVFKPIEWLLDSMSPGFFS